MSAHSENNTNDDSTVNMADKDSNILSTDNPERINKNINSKEIKTQSNSSNKITPNITVKNKTSKTNTSVILEANLPDDASGKALFKINGLTIGEAFRVKGGLVTYEYKIPTYSSKNYTITFAYGGNDIYESIKANGTLTLNKLRTSATVKSNKTRVAQSESIRFDVKIKNELNAGIIDAFVIKIGGQTIGKNITNSDGEGYLYYTIPNTYKINNYTVQLVYGDTNTAYGNRINSTLHVNNPTKIKMDNIAITKTSGILTIKTKVTDSLKNNVSSGEVVYKINGITMGSCNLTNGEATFVYKLPLYAPRNYTITALYGGNKYYKPNSVNKTLTLIKADSKLSADNDILIVGQSNKLNITLKDGFDNPIDNFNVRLLINNKEVGSYAVKNGSALINYNLKDVDSSKNITSMVVFDANKYYNKATLNLNVINPTKITIKDIIGNKSTGYINLTGNIIDSLNNKVNIGKIEYKLDNKSLFNISISNGTSSINYRLPLIAAGGHNITAIYHGNDYYQDSMTVKQFTVYKLNTILSINNSTITMNALNNLKIYVRDEYTNKVTNGNVRLLINNKNVATAPVKNGSANISYTLKNIDSTKQVNASVVYDSNEYYNPSNITLNVANPTKITVNANECKTNSSLHINATITDVFNNKVTNGKVEFCLDNKSIVNATIKDGFVSTTYKLPLLVATKHNITAKYIPEGKNYRSSNSTINVNIQKLNTKINTVNVNVTVGYVNKTNVTIIDEVNNPVKTGIIKLYVNNQDMGSFIVRNGTSTISFKSPNNISNDALNYRLQYISNDYYNGASANAKLNVFSLDLVYVSPNGNNDNLGDSKNPYRTISYALNHVKSGGRIYINPGEYNESNMNITQTVNILGVNSGRVIINPNRNSYVFNNINSNSNLTLVNITIQNANIQAANTSTIISKGPLKMINCSFTNNHATGLDSSSAVYAINDLIISSCTFSNNSAKANGGVLKSVGNKVSIALSKFINNSVNGSNIGGGALYLNNANCTIESSIFNNNQVNGVNVTGGAIKKVAGNLTLDHVNLAYNTITGSGYNVGGSIINLNGYLYVIDSTINSNNVSSTDNSAAAALYNQNAIVLVYNSIITNNKAVGKNVLGGSIQNYNVYMSIVGTNFTYNNATAANNQAIGGAIYHNNGTISITTSRFHSNTVKANNSYAAAIYFVGSKFTVNQTQFNRNIANGTSAGGAGALFIDANSTITSSNFTSNQALGKSNGGGAIINAGNLTANNNNFISNIANATGSAISNSGKVIDANNNYWGSSSPNWNKLIHGFSKPSKYSSKAI